MRYIGRDAENIYLKCSHCKKISAYDRVKFENQPEKECGKCGTHFRIIWGYPIKIPKFLRWPPFVIMTSLSLFIVFVICFPPFQRYYYFNKSITALNPLLASILVPALCSFMSIITEIKSFDSSEKIKSGFKNKINLVAVITIESVLLIFGINIIIQTKYCCVEIENPETGEIQQYFGSAIGDFASGIGRLFDSQGNLIYLGEFKNNLYDGYGEKWELVKTIRNSEVAQSYQCVYKGNFKSGLFHGQGCEYRYDAEYNFEKEKGISPYLYYEGEFKEGKYCGYGLLYNLTSKYEGVFFDGEFNGYGNEWFLDSSNNKIYKMEATYSDNVLNGAGKKYYPGGNLYFDGVYKNGKAVSGSMYFPSGSLRYTGEWNGSNYNGTGKLYWSNENLRYDGSWSDDNRKGYGTSFREDGTMEYSGYWDNNQYNGFGIWYYEDGTTPYLSGYYKDGVLNSTGTEYYRNGIERYSGNWTSGKWNGFGTWYWENGKKYYEGDFVEGIVQGEGILYSKDEVKIYEGTLINGERSGYGTSYFSDGTIQYQGYWEHNKYSGEGILYDEAGESISEGVFTEGELVLSETIEESSDEE